MNRGFTLIEIVVTLTIAAVAAAVAVPALSSLLRERPRRGPAPARTS